jgi:hypothetical protein
MEKVTKKIVLLRWVGRFGNRMFLYAFGCSYAKKYDCIFYIPSEWEGTVIFKDNKYTKVISDDDLRHHSSNYKSVTDHNYRKENFENYKKRTGDSIELVEFDNKKNIGKTNIAFQETHCMFFPHLFEIIDLPGQIIINRAVNRWLQEWNIENDTDTIKFEKEDCDDVSIIVIDIF